VEDTPEDQRQSLIDALSIGFAEDCIAAPLALQAWEMISLSKEKDSAKFLLGIEALAQGDQASFGVREILIHQDDWSVAVESLVRISDGDAIHRSLMVDAILDCASQIHSECAKKVSAVGGDELIPILLFVVSRAAPRLPHLVTVVHFLMSLLSSHAMESKPGYYLSVLESCLGYFQNAAP